ncbi:hypothetical protein GF348_09345 [candidate division KSB3 bacterium]|nr:hypothetical protein [candidate division KSB3 bacterium]
MPVHIFIRLMRSGSTTITTLLRKHQGCTDLYVNDVNPATEIVIDPHVIGYGFHEDVGIEDHRYFTILRDPADWLVSMYHLDCARRNLNITFPTWYNTVGRCTTYPFNVFRDRMTSWYKNKCRTKTLDDTIAILQKFWMVGITEELDTLIGFFKKHFHLDYPVENQRVTGQVTEVEGEKLYMQPRFTLSDEWRERIYEENPSDVKLYEAAKTIWGYRKRREENRVYIADALGEEGIRDIAKNVATKFVEDRKKKS